MHLLGQQRFIEKDPRKVTLERSGREAGVESKEYLGTVACLSASKVCRGSALA